MTKRSTTMNRGADDERAAWMRKIRTLMKEQNDYHPTGIAVIEECERLLKFGKGRSKRASAKSGGLGRK